MRKVNKSHIAVFLSVYMMLALIIGFMHNHDADECYHDFCIACQWEIQSRNIDSVTPLIWNSILFEFYPSNDSVPIENVLYVNQFYADSNKNRGPPFL